ncbi:hypothetical protein PMAYCL1PPCAC_04662, partial [Pristionchus mayeri]
MFTTFVGIPTLPSIFPSHLLDASNEILSSNITFKQRLQNFLMEGMISVVGSFFLGKDVDVLFRETYGKDFPSNGELMYD